MAIWLLLAIPPCPICYLANDSRYTSSSPPRVGPVVRPIVPTPGVAVLAIGRTGWMLEEPANLHISWNGWSPIFMLSISFWDGSHCSRLVPGARSMKFPIRCRGFQ